MIIGGNKTGVNAGSGVMAGGQQGKGVGNGVSGVQRGGGIQTGASRSRPRTAAMVAAAARTSAVSNAQKAKDPYRSVVRNGKRVMVRLSQLTGPEKASFNVATRGPQLGSINKGEPVAEHVASVTATPPPPSFDAYRDADYWEGLQGEERSFNDQNSQLVSKLAGLNAKGVGGKTIYDLMYEQANAGFTRNFQQSRASAAKQGVLRSGYMDRTAEGLSKDYVGEQDKLMREYGTDVNDQRSAAFQTVSQQKTLEQRLLEAKAALAKSAAARGQANYLAQTAQAYTPYIPEGN